MSVSVGPADQLVAVGGAQLVALGGRHAARHVAADRIGRRLVGDDVGREAALEQGVHHVGDVGDEPDRDRLAPLPRAEHQRERALEIVAAVLQVALAQAPLDALGIDLDDERSHAPASTPASGCAPPMPPRPAVRTKRPASEPPKCSRAGGHERLVGALQDPLRADVLPGARRHPAEHREARVDQLLPAGHRRPAADDVAVGDHRDRREPVRVEEADRLARLDDERLILAPSSGAPRRCGRSSPSRARPWRSPRRRPAPRAARRSRGCSRACAGSSPAASPCSAARRRAAP